MRTRDGFTLLEILIALAILGLVAGLFSTGLVRYLQTVYVQDASSQLATDLRKARSLAQRNSQDMVISFTPGAGGKTGIYMVDGKTVTLPNNIQFACTFGCGTATSNQVAYQAPYGELVADSNTSIGKVLTVYPGNTGLAAIEIRVMGVSGKVMVVKP